MSGAPEARGYAHRVDIRAELSQVWEALTAPQHIQQWYGRAEVDARPGGSYELLADADMPRVAHIDVFRPPHRLRLIYLPLPEYPHPDAVLIDDFVLDAAPRAKSAAVDDAVTVVRLLGSGYPEGGDWDLLYVRVRAGWERALLKLKSLLERPAAACADSARR